MAEQRVLLDRMEAPGPAAVSKGEECAAPLKLRVLDRSQLRMLTLDVDSLIGPDHKARAI